MFEGIYKKRKNPIFNIAGWLLLILVCFIFLFVGYSPDVDFMGSGGSEGNQTTIGFLEAKQVKTCFDYLTEKGEKNIFLFGTSMGSVAIMKAISDFDIKPKAIISALIFK